MSIPLHNELTHIKSGIDSQLTELAAQISSAQIELDGLCEVLPLHAEERAENAASLAQAQNALAEITRTHATHSSRMEHVHGTQVETAMQSELATIEAQRNQAAATVNALQRDAAKLTQTEQQQIARQAELRLSLSAFYEKRADLEANRAHFDKLHAESVRDEALAHLDEANAEIAQLEAQLEAAKAQRQQRQADLAAALSPWPELAAHTLSEVCIFDEHSTIRALRLKKQFAEELEQGTRFDLEIMRELGKAIPVQDILNYGGRPHLQRQRKLGTLSNPIIARFEDEMLELDRVLSQAQETSRNAQVHALIEQAAQEKQQQNQ